MSFVNEADSIVCLIDRLRASDEEAAAKLWEQYFQRLVAQARSMLHSALRRTTDEEDLALSAFASFCRGIEAGRFPKIGDRDNLWAALFSLLARKSAHLHRDQARQKRDIRRTLDESALTEQTGGQLDLNAFAGREPSPEFIVEVTEECERQLRRLDDDAMREIALLKMEGYTNEEIAAKLAVAPRTVERRLGLIREIWLQSDVA